MWKEKGTIFHCLWQCSQIKTFWEKGLDSQTIATISVSKLCSAFCSLFQHYQKPFQPKKTTKTIADNSVFIYFSGLTGPRDTTTYCTFSYMCDSQCVWYFKLRVCLICLKFSFEILHTLGIWLYNILNQVAMYFSSWDVNLGGMVWLYTSSENKSSWFHQYLYYICVFCFFFLKILFEA